MNKPKPEPPVTLTPARVGVWSFPKSTEQARTAVDPDKKWSWVQDGPALKAAVEAALDELRAQAEPVLLADFGVPWSAVKVDSVKRVITDVVKRWDDLFGWDAPNMTEMDEDAFYVFLVNETVGRRFKNAI